MTLISLLILLVAFALIIWALGLLPIPDPFRTIIYVVAALILIVYLLRFAGVAAL